MYVYIYIKREKGKNLIEIWQEMPKLALFPQTFIVKMPPQKSVKALTTFGGVILSGFRTKGDKTKFLILIHMHPHCEFSAHFLFIL